MQKVNTDFLKVLKYRYDEQISEADILAWLYNFEEEDWESALILMNQISFYSESRCCKILKDGLLKIKDECTDMPIVFLPIGGIGKSGAVMAYYVKKVNVLNQKLSFVDLSYDFKNQPHAVILLDDFLGSGRSAAELLEELIDKIPVGSKCFCLCVAYMQKANTLLEKSQLKIFGDLHLPAFVSRHSVFGSAPKVKRIRDFATKYGAKLYPKRVLEKGRKYYVGPLGYANSQALVCFQHTTPNNSLPILWASKRRLDNNVYWTPLFPRFQNDRMNRDQTFERKKYYWLSILQKKNMGVQFKHLKNYSQSSIDLLGLLYAKYHLRSEFQICSLLEITQSQLKQLQQEANNLGLLDSLNMLTPAGKALYLDIRKNALEKKSFIEYQTNTSNSVYLPKEFLGLSKNESIS